MSAPSAPAAPLNLLWLCCGLALVFGMSTLASGNNAIVHWVVSTSTGLAVQAAEPVEQGVPQHGFSVGDGFGVPFGAPMGVPFGASRVAPLAARLHAVASSSVDAPPFAPGGDDLLPHSDAEGSPAPPMARAGPSPEGGAQRATPATSGAWSIRPHVALAHRVQGISPMPVHKTSDGNLNQIDFDLHLAPSLRELGLLAPALQASEDDAAFSKLPDLQTVGDFFQQGRAARWTLAFTARGASRVYVLARDGQDRWSDRSVDVLPDEVDRQACHRPTQALTADFNADGKPDVYLACEGQQVLFLSQSDGRYRRLATPFQLAATQAQALDVDGDGLVDVITIDTQTGVPRALVLYGRGDGRFGVQWLDANSDLARELFQRRAPLTTPTPPISPVATATQGRP